MIKLWSLWTGLRDDDVMVSGWVDFLGGTTVCSTSSVQSLVTSH